MSSWNEETKTLHNSDGRLISVHGTSLHAKDLMVPGLQVKVPGLAAADLAAFGRAVLAAAGEPVAATPAPFKVDAAFDDVQVGDRVRMTLAGAGHIETHEGVIATLASVGEPWHRADSGRGIVCRTVFSGETRTITILSRPTPQLPTEPGSQIDYRAADGTVRLTLTRNTGEWVGISVDHYEVRRDAANIHADQWTKVEA